MLQLVSSFSRLTLLPRISQFSQETVTKLNFHTSCKVPFSLTDPNFSSVSKKKKKADPGQLKAKEEKRKRKLAKALKKMEKKDRQPKPLIECEVPLHLHKEAGERKREFVVNQDEEEERIHLMKDWSRFTLTRHRNEIWKQDIIQITQQMALDELRKESEDLYLSAIQFDSSILPISFKGPVSTPPIENYLQDGEYKDTTQTYKVIYEDTEAFMKNLLQRQRKKKKTSEEED